MKLPPAPLRATAARPSPVLLRSLALAIVPLAVPALAASWSPVAQAQQQPEMARYDIPPGALAGALNRFAQQAGIALSYPPALAEGQRSPGLQGSHSIASGFAALLQGTGLEAVAGAGGGYSLRALPASAPAAAGAAAGGLLPEVRVSAALPESAHGSVHGYIARRAATATKTDTPLAETSQSISVIGRAQMDDRGVQTVTEAYQYSAGITGDNAADNRYDKPVIRGFAARQYLDGLHLIYGTGVYNMPRVEPFGLERVEILRGPASVLYGANAPGGLVNLVSKRPTGERLAEVGVSVGSFDRREGRFDIGGAVDANGVLSWRLTGLARSGGTQTAFADDDRVFVAPALTWRPNADTSLTLLASYQRDKLGTLINFLPREGTLAPYAYAPRQIPTDFFTGEPAFNTFEREASSAGWAFTHRFREGLTFRQNLRYQRSDMVYQGVYAAGWQPRTPYLRRASLDAYGDLTSLVLDNQLEWRQRAGAWQHTVLAGIDHQKASSYEAQGYGTVGTGLGLIDPQAPLYGQRINPITSYTGSLQHQRQTGAYAQYQGSFDARWFLTAALRRDKASSDTVSSRFNASTRAGTASTAGLDQSDTTYRLGLLYKTANGWSPYLSWSTSFLPQAGVDHLNQPFKPTTARQTEVGVKYQPEGACFQLTGSLYDLRQQNVVASLPEAGLTARRQIGEVRARGLELEALADLPSGFKLTTAWTFMDMEILRGSAAETGKTPTNRPRHMFSAWVDKTIDGGPLTGLSLGVGLRHMGASWGDSANLFKVPSATVVDAAVRYTTGRWRFALNLSNLFDKKYIGTCGSATTCYYEYRRNAKLSANYAF